MTVLAVLLLLAQPAPLTLDQVRGETNPEHRAKVAVEFAASAERAAEAAYDHGDMNGVAAALKNMTTAVEIARDALDQTGKSPLHHPGPYKLAEVRTQETLMRLSDLEKRMEPDEREVVQGPKEKVQEIHDVWFDGIMGTNNKKR